MTREEKLRLFEAWLDGKPIEFYYNGEWLTVGCPAWNFGLFNYRVKPEEPKPTYRPYANARECFFDAIKNGWFVRKATKNGSWLMKLFVSEDSVITEERSISFRDLLESYTWEDGSPCGVKEE